MLNFDTQQKLIHKLLSKPQNHLCSDCNGKYPCWASLDFGVFICMNCSGAHRALGPSITRVKSTKLDSWHSDWIKNMTIGNSNINLYWEAKLNSHLKPTPSSSLQEIKRYTVDKYVKKLFTIDNETDPLTNFKNKNYQIPNNNQGQTKEAKKVTLPPKANSQKKQPAKPALDFKDFLQLGVPSKKTIQNSKKQANLLDILQQQPQVKITNPSKNTFDSFNFFELNEPPKKQVKIDRSSFNSFSGNKTINSTTGNNTLQNIFKSKINNDYFNQPNPKLNQIFESKKSAEVMNLTFLDNSPVMPYTNQQSQFLTTAYQNYNRLPYCTNSPGNLSQNFPGMHLPTQVTMNINMNMYPHVMNINLLAGGPSTNQVNSPPHSATEGITLEVKEFQKEKSKQSDDKSWVDQWK